MIPESKYYHGLGRPFATLRREWAVHNLIGNRQPEVLPAVETPNWLRSLLGIA
jgi:hypothetical protein